MAVRIQSMTEGKPSRLIFSFALPLMVGNVFQQLYTVVDTMVVGKYLGVSALAALGAADWLNWMMLGIIQGFTQGFGILMAREFGAGEHDRLRDVIGESAVLSALFALLLVAAAVLSKVVGCGLGGLACRMSRHQSLVVGIGMVARSEVALMVAQRGISAGMIDPSILPAIVLAVIASALVTPVLLKMAITKGPALV